MKTQTAIDKAGSKAKLAKLLNVSRQAVSKWGSDMPPLRAYELKELKPRWFSRGQK